MAIAKKLRDESMRLPAWRVYDAICEIPTGDLTVQQRQLIVTAREKAYKQYEQACRQHETPYVRVK